METAQSASYVNADFKVSRREALAILKGELDYLKTTDWDRAGRYGAKCAVFADCTEAITAAYIKFVDPEIAASRRPDQLRAYGRQLLDELHKLWRDSDQIIDPEDSKYGWDFLKKEIDEHIYDLAGPPDYSFDATAIQAGGRTEYQTHTPQQTEAKPGSPDTPNMSAGTPVAPGQRPRGPQPDYAIAERVNEIIQKFHDKGGWRQNQTDVWYELDERKVPCPKTWKKKDIDDWVDCGARAPKLAVLAITYRLSLAKKASRAQTFTQLS